FGHLSSGIFPYGADGFWRKPRICTVFVPSWRQCGQFPRAITRSWHHYPLRAATYPLVHIARTRRHVHPCARGLVVPSTPGRATCQQYCRGSSPSGRAGTSAILARHPALLDVLQVFLSRLDDELLHVLSYPTVWPYRTSVADLPVCVLICRCGGDNCRWPHRRPDRTETGHLDFHSGHGAICVVFATCKSYGDRCFKYHQRVDPCFSLSRDSRLCHRIVARDGRDHLRSIFWFCVRLSGHLFGCAGKAGVRQEHPLCGQSLFVPSIDWPAHGLSSRVKNA